MFIELILMLLGIECDQYLFVFFFIYVLQYIEEFVLKIVIVFMMIYDEWNRKKKMRFEVEGY